MKNKIPVLVFSVLLGTFTFLVLHFFYSLGEDTANFEQSKTIKSIPIENSFKMVSNNSISVDKALDFNIAAEKTVNAVVHISSEYNQTYNSDPMLDFFWGPDGSRGMRPQIATGSGVIISKNGYNDFRLSGPTMMFWLFMAGPMTVIPLFLYVRGVELIGLGSSLSI